MPIMLRSIRAIDSYYPRLDNNHGMFLDAAAASSLKIKGAQRLLLSIDKLGSVLKVLGIPSHKLLHKHYNLTHIHLLIAAFCGHSLQSLPFNYQRSFSQLLALTL